MIFNYDYNDNSWLVICYSFFFKNFEQSEEPTDFIEIKILNNFDIF